MKERFGSKNGTRPDPCQWWIICQFKRARDLVFSFCFIPSWIGVIAPLLGFILLIESRARQTRDIASDSSVFITSHHLKQLSKRAERNEMSTWVDSPVTIVDGPSIPTDRSPGERLVCTMSMAQLERWVWVWVRGGCYPSTLLPSHPPHTHRHPW